MKTGTTDFNLDIIDFAIFSRLPDTCAQQMTPSPASVAPLDTTTADTNMHMKSALWGYIHVIKICLNVTYRHIYYLTWFIQWNRIPHVQYKLKFYIIGIQTLATRHSKISRLRFEQRESERYKAQLDREHKNETIKCTSRWYTLWCIKQTKWTLYTCATLDGTDIAIQIAAIGRTIIIKQPGICSINHDYKTQ